MDKLKMDNNISKTKKSFEASFSEAEYYNKQTQDPEHLNSILNVLTLKDEDILLDLGTGSGYLAFAIAKKYPRITIIGLDIVTDTLNKNKKKAQDQGISNIEFVNYDGENFPFRNEYFNWVVSRYALHHFPDIQHTICEVERVLKHSGSFFISDPTPNDIDVLRFVDTYMQLKDDGHNKFYTLDEFIMYANNSGMKYANSYLSSIRFPRKIERRCFDLLQKTNDKIKQSYNIKVIKDECYISENVVNAIFLKL